MATQHIQGGNVYFVGRMAAHEFNNVLILFISFVDKQIKLSIVYEGCLNFILINQYNLI